MNNAVRIWENHYELLMKIRSKSERNALAFAMISYGFTGEIPSDLKLNQNNLIIFDAIKNNFIAKKQGGREKRLTNSSETVNQSLSDNIYQITDNNSNISSQDKSCKEISNETVPEKKQNDYVFSGSVIRLKAKDFDEWSNTFPELNLRAELMVRDQYLAKQSDAEKKNWFMSTFQYFIKQNEKRKAQNKDFADEEEEDFETWLKRSV